MASDPFEVGKASEKARIEAEAKAFQEEQKRSKRNEKLIKVSAGDFNNESVADQEARKIADALNQATWIYKK